MKNKKTIDDVMLDGKRVIIRVDFNVPMKDGKITNNKRIVAAIPTIKKAYESNAKVILLSHLGRVKIAADKKVKTLKPVAAKLSKLINKPVKFIPETSGQTVKDAVKEMNPGDIIMLENTRFEDLNDKAESKNNARLAKFWASLGDVFVNDAFGTSHRSHASNVGIASNVAESCVGYLVEKEIKMISKAINKPERPAVAIIGGAKIADKIKTIDFLINNVDKVIIGGGMAHVFAKAQGIAVGNSIVKDDTTPESKLIEIATEYLKKYQDKIVLPIDWALASKFDNVSPIYNTSNSLEIPAGYYGLDVGPKTVAMFKKILSGVKTVIWNGPMGVCEFSNYAYGTRELARVIGNLPGAYTIVGGGDSVAAIMSLGLEDKFSHVSTGGGACLMMLEGKDLPGIVAIQNENESARKQVDASKPASKTSEIKTNDKAKSGKTAEVKTSNNNKKTGKTSEIKTKK